MTAVQLQVTTDDEATAHRLAHELVAARLAACAQVLGPITSHYRWNDRLQVAREWLLLVKTEEDRVAAAVAAVASRHPAEVPEIVALAVVGGHDAYLGWVHDATRPPA